MKTNPVFVNVTLNSEVNNERGMTIVMVAISILLLMAMAALAVDVGVLYTARTSAQHAADAAALAGAYTFTINSDPQPDSAQNAAVAAAAKNAVMGKAVTLAPADVVVDTVRRRVTVTVNRNVGGNRINTFFAGALGISQMGTQARAVAEAATKGTAARCVKPVFAPNTSLSALEPADACNAKEFIFNPDGSLSAFANQAGILGQCLQIRPTRPQDAKNALAPGQFFSLDFGAGANTYSCTWGGCLNQCKTDTDLVQCGKSYPVKTGDMVGPTKSGVDDLIGKPADVWKQVDQYYPGGDTTKIVDTSRALSIVPVWDNCNPPGNTIVSGTSDQSVKVLGFLEVFVDGQDKFTDGCLGPNSAGSGGKGKGDWVHTHIVKQIDCADVGGGGAGAGTPNSGPFAIPIRLVQVP
jgi:Flp pilus assembly protein TadG